jgi:excisionase family DNA binding protein
VTITAPNGPMTRGDIAMASPSLSPPEWANSAAALLDVRQVAMLLHCSPRHVYRLADAGRMPRPRRLASLVRWSRAEVEQWVDAGCPPVRTFTAKGARP